MTRKGEFYGPDNRALDTGEDPDPIPVGIQALVKAEVNTAMNTARESLQSDAEVNSRSNKTKASIRYGIQFLINVVFCGLLWVFGPSEVREWTREFVKNNMNRRALKLAAREVMETEAESFVENELAPLDARVSETDAAVTAAASRLNSLVEGQLLVALARVS